ncbi:Uncharacterised protein [Mycobacteroides abscessus subsp. abscessus]|nr:Uncharacterised protein [Mycobacteroides abscessus subsp. abscessus]
MVASTVLRLSITLPISASRSPRVLAKEPPLSSSDTSVPPCPWNTCNSASVRSFTWPGSRPRSSGLNPPSSMSRSRAGAVRSLGMVPPAFSTSAEPGPSSSSR